MRKVLHFFEFPENFIDLVLYCISSSRVNILFNGERLETFLPSRGIRQGDSISPYIFILCMEYLSLMIKGEVNQGNWSGIRLARGSLRFSYLFFADNVLLFSSSDLPSCETIRRVLNVFCSLSGQKINLSKSSVLFKEYSLPIESSDFKCLVLP